MITAEVDKVDYGLSLLKVRDTALFLKKIMKNIGVFSIDGRQISISTSENKNGQTVFDLRDVKSGMYFIKVKNENGIELHKVVVHH